MSRKHFIALAAALRANGADYSTCADVANVCADFNKNFDLARFMAACGHS